MTEPTFQPDAVLDTEDAICPVPILMTREAVRGLKAGQILKVVSRDPASKADIQVWASRVGNEVLKVEEEAGGRFVFYLRKGVSADVSGTDEDIQMSTKKVSHFRLRVSEGLLHTVESDVTLEVPVHVKVNGRDEVTIMATPTRLEDLAVGYLLDEGIVDNLGQIKRVEVRGVDVDVKTEMNVTGRIEAVERMRLVTSECVSLEHYLQLKDLKLPEVKSDYRLSAIEVSRMVREFNLKNRSEDQPGGIHSAAIFEDGVLRHYLLDVSRHSAVDKVVGAGAREGVDFTRSVVMTSGRQPAGMVLKAARVNVPISVSMRGPIYSGILAAQKTRVTLIGYATPSRLDIYSEEARILLP